MIRSLLGPAVALLATCAVAGAQPIPRAGAPGLPPRDPVQPQAPLTGTARIRGRVVASDSGQPIRKAVVRVNAAELRGEMRMTSTDPEGRYEFRDLPAGRYTVSASKGAYVTLQYGQTRPFEQGRPLQVLDNQTVEKIDFALPRGSVITGRVIDEYGDPVADAQVAPLRMQFTPRGRQQTPAGRFASTNDVGEFRMFGLPPGEYLISASLRNFEGPIGVSDDRSGYVATFYPGTANIAEAQLVRVGVGETLNDITIMLMPTRTARISGVVLNAEGKPAGGGMVMVIQRTAGMFFGNAAGQIRPDGTFSVGGLAPGDYMLRAQGGPIGPNGPADVATARVTVSGADVEGVRVTPARFTTITGKLVVDPASGSALKPETVRLMLTPKDPADVPIMMPQPVQSVKEDGTFELKAYPGTVSVILVQVPNWMLKSVRVNGVEVIDSGFEMRADEDLDNVQVEVTDRLPELSGSVADDRGRPVVEYTAIAFPQEPAPGTVARSSVARPDQDGRFKFRPLRAGNYYVAAVEYVEQGQWLDPEYLERLRPSATRVTIGDGETKAVDLKLLKP